MALIAASCFFSMSEISLAAARKIRLRQMADEGDERAERVLELQARPGNFSLWCKLASMRLPLWAVLWGIGVYSLHQSAAGRIDSSQSPITSQFCALLYARNQYVYFDCGFDA